jgi:hypothetical protein
LTAFAGMGLASADVVPACLALIDFVLGAVYFETGRGAAEMQLAIGAAGGPADDGLDDDAADDHPALVAHRRDLAAVTAEETFAFGLRAFLDGLAGT